MTKGERQELSALVRKREKVMKMQAQERSAFLLAEFDAASAKIYHYDDDAVWAQAQAEAQKAVEAAQEAIEARCKELGIPKEFAPGLQIYWHGRGQNALADRRAELRRAAKSRIAALEADAIAKIERLSLEVQTEIVAHGLESAAAKQFLETMPKLDALMPPLQFTDVQALVERKKHDQRHRLEWMN